MQRKYWWAIGAAVGAGVLLLSSRKTVQMNNGVVATSSDIDNLARMLIAETGFTRNQDEMAQIVWVAINRALKRGFSLSKVVVPPGTPTWNTGSPYRTRFNSADRNPRFEAARQFVASVLAGQWPQKIAGRTSFVHPSGMPKPPCADNRVATQTAAGTRCLPLWAQNGKVVGGALFA